MEKLHEILAMCLAVFLCLVLAILPPQPGITKKNFERIQKGMKLAEVERIFGRPGEERESHPDKIRLLAWKPYPDVERDVVHVWLRDDSVVMINWWVGRGRWMDDSEDLVDRIRRWLHLE